MEQVSKTITVKKARAEVFAFWRNFENLSHFMIHLVRVDVTSPTKSHW